MPIEVFTIPLVIAATYLFSTLIGYAVHRALHHQWTGFLNKAHMTHHTIKYPPKDLLSEKYRRAGKDNTVFIFIPIILAMFGVIIWLYAAGILPVFYTVLMSSEILVISLMHEFLHNAFHLYESVWHHFPRFEELKELHFEHHRNMKKNFGIVDFFWDRVFKSEVK